MYKEEVIQLEGLLKARNCHLTPKYKIAIVDLLSKLKKEQDKQIQCPHCDKQIQLREVNEEPSVMLNNKDKPCPECGDLGWAYSKDLGSRTVCPCHL